MQDLKIKLENNKIFFLIISFTIFSFYVFANEITDPSKTEIWEPSPKIVSISNKYIPSDAIILFDGNSLANWNSIEGGDAPWLVENNFFTIKPGSGNIVTKRKFTDVQLHIEWRTPLEVTKKCKIMPCTGQGEGNSGVFLQKRYEVQILDSFENKTYVNGQAGSIYKQFIPLVNVSKEPGTWQTYDIIFRAPTFDDNKNLKKNALMTVLHNGVLIQNNSILRGSTAFIGYPKYEFHEGDSIMLQDHGNEVSFRNIWVREL
ncbi:MAG: hypothetical protein CMQ54_05585 [Gammaproteobacteria bacterium]|nr:hypothetical protein [Gammaproteobacteria bacterium]|tara:strand:- start:50 stop:829 length:780 start_codon:yes stop_codon:yes gene_type:complete